jgi:hypothetical protein
MPGGGYAPAMGAPNDGQATLSLILGIISVLCCPILGPVALFIGNASRQRIQASGGTLGGAGLAMAGLVLGVIGTVFLALGVIGIVVGVANGLRTTP